MLVLLPDDHLEQVQERRRQWGAAKQDEVWNGIHHLRPVGSHSGLQQELALLLSPRARERGLVAVLGAFEPRELGERRVSDLASPGLRGDQVSTAALAVEIVTGGEDSQRRLPGLAADGVGELVIVDLGRQTVDWLSLIGDEYRPVERSGLIVLGPEELAERIDWPPSAPATDEQR